MTVAQLDVALDRQMPQSPDAERAVLGAILINNHAFYRIIGTIDTDDFFKDAHRTIFAHDAAHGREQPGDRDAHAEGRAGQARPARPGWRRRLHLRPARRRPRRRQRRALREDRQRKVDAAPPHRDGQQRHARRPRRPERARRRPQHRRKITLRNRRRHDRQRLRRSRPHHPRRT